MEEAELRMRAQNLDQFSTAMEASVRNVVRDKEKTERVIENLDEAIRWTNLHFLTPMVDSYNTSFIRLTSLWPRYAQIVFNHAVFITAFLDEGDELDGVKKAISDPGFVRLFLPPEEAESVVRGSNETLKDALWKSLRQLLPWFISDGNFKAEINRDYFMYMHMLNLKDLYANFTITKREWALKHRLCIRLPVSYRVGSLEHPTHSNYIYLIH